MESPSISDWPGFTPEGYRVYEAATQQIRHALANGHTYDEACSMLCNIPANLKSFISADFLKILIAEEHFGAGVDIKDLAFLLGMPYERINAATLSLLDEMAQAAIVTAPSPHSVASKLTH